MSDRRYDRGISSTATRSVSPLVLGNKSLLSRTSDAQESTIDAPLYLWSSIKNELGHLLKKTADRGSLVRGLPIRLSPLRSQFNLECKFRGQCNRARIAREHRSWIVEVRFSGIDVAL